MGTDGTVEYDGVLLDISDDVIGQDVRQAFSEGWYERYEAELVRNYLPPSIDVIELGAGIGYVSCVIDEILMTDNRHIAVEPNSRIIPILKRTKELNDANYDIWEGAYSSTSGPVELQQHEDYWNATTHLFQNGSVKVRSINLQDICETYGVSIFTLVVDIEGAEYELFSAELDLLEDQCPLLIVEFHEEGPYAASYDDDLEKSTFELVDGIETVCVYQNKQFSGGSDDSTEH